MASTLETEQSPLYCHLSYPGDKYGHWIIEFSTTKIKSEAGRKRRGSEAEVNNRRRTGVTEKRNTK